MISKHAVESLPHQCSTPNCNYKRLKNRAYFRASLAGQHPQKADDPGWNDPKVLFLDTKSRARRNRRRSYGKVEA